MSIGHIFQENLYTDDECNRINVKVGTIDAKSAVVTSLNLPRGTKTAPTVTFSTDTTTGYYSASANHLDFSVSGNNVLQLHSGNNLHLGYLSDPLNISSGSNNYSFGQSTGTSLTSGAYNVSLGGLANNKVTTGSSNVAVGVSSNTNCVGGSSNIAVGYASLLSNTASGNVSIGDSSGFSNTSGSSNCFVGYHAGFSNTTASDNTLLGYNSGSSITTAPRTTSVGKDALLAFSNGSDNVAIGYKSLSTTVSSSNNTAVGTNSGIVLSAGNNNTLLGYNSGNGMTTAGSNVLIGYAVGTSLVSGANNVIIGSGANCTGANTGMIVIGQSASGVIDNATIIKNPSANAGLYMNSLRDANKTTYVEFDPVTYELTYNAVAPSSIVYKENFRPLELKDVVDKVPTYTFDYNERAPDRYKGRRGHGVKAQDIEQYFPEACKYVKNADGIDELYTVNYEMLVIPLWERVRELSKEMAELRTELNNFLK